MYNSKQPPYLTGAHYGSPISPPPSPPPKTYRRPGRGCCCRRLFSFIFTLILIAASVVVALASLFWLLLRPKMIEFHVTDAVLTPFDLNTTTGILRYDLALNLTVRNPNRHIGVHYDRLGPRAYYVHHYLRNCYRFRGPAALPHFYQGHENTTRLGLAFWGENVLVLKESDISEYEAEKGSGVYRIGVKLFLGVGFDLLGVSTPRFNPKVDCELKVPLASNNGKASGSIFQTTRCGLHW